MKFKKNIEFDKTVEAFKKMSLTEKQRVVIDELKEILAFMDMTMTLSGLKCEVLYNKEILDMEHNYTEDDFVESVYVYINAIKELLGSYVNSQIKK